MAKPVLKNLYVGVGLKKEGSDCLLVFASVDPDKDKCERSARGQLPDSSILVLNVMRDGKLWKDDLSNWFADNDIIGADASEGIRSFVAGMKSFIERDLKGGHK